MKRKMKREMKGEKTGNELQTVEVDTATFLPLATVHPLESCNSILGQLQSLQHPRTNTNSNVPESPKHSQPLQSCTCSHRTTKKAQEQNDIINSVDCRADTKQGQQNNFFLVNTSQHIQCFFSNILKAVDVDVLVVVDIFIETVIIDDVVADDVALQMLMLFVLLIIGIGDVIDDG
ncbi:hypothetical protein HELRODRAFT_179148 [Helobdella robusta]|uniref:Uncharacterized protein n=1 Tax=Helobdella robusta TaxID=6412 RepID=T1FE91_HELRO|nr:hypothetical protein HELRODRAFT_179148 [Helobdella robusta]ESN95677.1 hypothetical protein HELRODRAFT_179148 [Helobdella robusta]